MAANMNRRTRTIRTALVLLVNALLLAACTAPPPPPPPADEVVVGTDPNLVVDTLSLAPGEWRNYRLTVPAGVRETYDVVYLELANTEMGAVLELRNPGYWNVLASSATTSKFVRGRLAGVPQPVPEPAGVTGGAVTAPAADRSEVAAIGALRVCTGPCVIFRAHGGTYYARVINDGGTTITADLHLYGYDLEDGSEPQNDLRSTAPVLELESEGALELIGDVDYWLAADDLAVTLTANAGVDAEARVVSSAGLVVAGPYLSGATFSVFEGEALRVRAADNSSAGAAGASAYYLSSEPLPPGTPGRPPTEVEVEASTNPNTPLDSRVVQAGQTIEYLLRLQANVRSRDLLYVELDREVGLELRSGSGLSAIAASHSSSSFFAGGGWFSTAPRDSYEAVGPAAVDVLTKCRGSCVIVEPGASSYRVLVTNTGAARSISLYAYGAGFNDSTEPQNDTRGTAPVLIGDDAGAIETIGDTDYWALPYSGAVAFDAVTGSIALQAQVLGAGGAPVAGRGGPHSAGSTITVVAGEFLRVWSTDPDEAAVAGASTYFLVYLTTSAAMDGIDNAANDPGEAATNTR